MATPPNPSQVPAILLRCFSAPRLAGYRAHCNGDLDAAIELYAWNTEITGALWESIGHLEVALRNVLADRLAGRHRRLDRPGSWLDDPACELDDKARKEISDARDRVRRNGKTLSDGQTISELGFGFWRYLLAKRYATTLWPDLASAFQHTPDRARSTVETPVKRLHVHRNRLAHHQRVWTEPLTDRWDDLRAVLGYIDPDLASWVTERSRVPAALSTCPVARPSP